MIQFFVFALAVFFIVSSPQVVRGIQKERSYPIGSSTDSEDNSKKESLSKTNKDEKKESKSANEKNQASNEKLQKSEGKLKSSDSSSSDGVSLKSKLYKLEDQVDLLEKEKRANLKIITGLQLQLKQLEERLKLATAPSEERFPVLMKENRDLQEKIKQWESGGLDVRNVKTEVDNLTKENKTLREKLSEVALLQETLARLKAEAQLFFLEKESLQKKLVESDLLKTDLANTKAQFEKLKSEKSSADTISQSLKPALQKTEEELKATRATYEEKVQNLSKENSLLKVELNRIATKNSLQDSKEALSLKAELLKAQSQVEVLENKRKAESAKNEELVAKLKKTEEKPSKTESAGEDQLVQNLLKESKLLRSKLNDSETFIKSLTQRANDEAASYKNALSKLKSQLETLSAGKGKEEVKPVTTQNDERVQTLLKENKDLRENLNKAEEKYKILSVDSQVLESLKVELAETKKQLESYQKEGSKGIELAARLEKAEGELKLKQIENQQTENLLKKNQSLKEKLSYSDSRLQDLEIKNKSEIVKNVELSAQLKKIEEKVKASAGEDQLIQSLLKENKSLKNKLEDSENAMKDLTLRVSNEFEIHKSELAKLQLLNVSQDEQLKSLLRENESIKEKTSQFEAKTKWVKNERSDLRDAISLESDDLKKGKEGRPIGVFSGTIAQLNRNGCFAIINFTRGNVPPTRSKLDVYRGGTVVGIIQITDPVMPPYASANIMKGSLQQGDEVR